MPALRPRGKDEFASMPAVVDRGNDLDVSTLPLTARRWIRLDDVVVVADLKNSTKLGTGSKAASTASIYQATTGSVARAYSAGDEPTVRVKAVLKALAELYPTAAAT